MQYPTPGVAFVSGMELFATCMPCEEELILGIGDADGRESLPEETLNVFDGI